MEEKKTSRKKIRIKSGRALLGELFLVCLFLVLLVNIITPTKTVSEDENRSLASKPKISFYNLRSGGLAEEYETYQKDQFLGRSLLRKVKVLVNRLGGSTMEQGVYIGKGGQLLEDIVVPDQVYLKANLDAMREFAAKYSNLEMLMILVPDAALLWNDKLPNLAVTADQSALISQVRKELESSFTWIDAVSALSAHSDEKIYYQTDHHWTTLGAYYVFQEAAATLGITQDVASEFVSYSVSTNFNGALSSVSGCQTLKKEILDIYVPKDVEREVVVHYVDEQRKTTSLYDSEKLQTKDQYAVFLGGNSSLIDIKTVSESQKRILVVKDSFANSFLPFLVPYYREIVVVDPRYYTGTMDEIMETYEVDQVLFLYRGNTFFSDHHLAGVLDSNS
jgi:hypothetical protein